jgi:hypothetical protein
MVEILNLYAENAWNFGGNLGQPQKNHDSDDQSTDQCHRICYQIQAPVM